MNSENSKMLSDRTTITAFSVLYALLTIGAILIVLAQILFYLWSGEWAAIPLGFLVAYLASDGFSHWLSHPQSWLGVHKILIWALSNIPLSVAMLFSGFFISLATESMKKTSNKSASRI